MNYDYGEVTVYASNGARRTFPSIVDAILALGGYCIKNVKDNKSQLYGFGAFIPEQRNGSWSDATYNGFGTRFLLVDELGLTITARDVLKVYNNLPRDLREGKKYRGRPYKFRQGPAGWGSKPSTGSWYRRPRTFNEKRVNDGTDDMFIRGSRRGHNLPSSWDDKYPAARRDRSWKRFRSTQYKTKDGG